MFPGAGVMWPFGYTCAAIHGVFAPRGRTKRVAPREQFAAKLRRTSRILRDQTRTTGPAILTAVKALTRMRG